MCVCLSTPQLLDWCTACDDLGARAADGFRLILSSSTDVLCREGHAVVKVVPDIISIHIYISLFPKLFYKQQLFVSILPKLMELVSSVEERMSLLHYNIVWLHCSHL